MATVQKLRQVIMTHLCEKYQDLAHPKKLSIWKYQKLKPVQFSEESVRFAIDGSGQKNHPVMDTLTVGTHSKLRRMG